MDNGAVAILRTAVVRLSEVVFPSDFSLGPIGRPYDPPYDAQVVN